MTERGYREGFEQAEEFVACLGELADLVFRVAKLRRGLGSRCVEIQQTVSAVELLLATVHQAAAWELEQYPTHGVQKPERLNALVAAVFAFPKGEKSS